MSQIEAAAQGAPAIEHEGTAHRSILSLFLGMVIRPRDTLAYLRDHGGHSWVWPALLALALTLASQAIVGGVQRAQLQARFEQFQQQGQQIEPGGETAEGSEASQPQFVEQSPLLQYGFAVGGLLGGWLVRAGLLWGLALVVRGTGTLGAMARMSIWTTLPDMARTLVVTVVSAITGTVSVPGLAFLREAGPAGGQGGFAQGVQTFTTPSFFTLFISQLLGRLDVYTVWGLILVGLGVAITARLSTLKSILVTGVFWLGSLALTVAPQLLGLGLGRFLGGGSGLPGGGRFIGPGGGGGPPPGGGGGGGAGGPNVVIVPGP